MFTLPTTQTRAAILLTVVVDALIAPLKSAVRTDLSFTELARMINPTIRGWMRY
jgi:hypothetical protein